MKSYWNYLCDEGHGWTLLRDFDAEERPEDSVCPFGHPAVTLQKHPLQESVGFSLHPAAQIADVAVKKQELYRNLYYLVVLDLHSDRQFIAPKPRNWDEALTLMSSLKSGDYASIVDNLYGETS